MSAEAAGGEGSGSILVDAVAAASQDVSAEAAAPETIVVATMSDETLALQDVLRGLPGDTNADDLGAYLSFESVGTSTVISIDADGAGPAAQIAIATLDNVTGVTLQQLLSSNEIQS